MQKRIKIFIAATVIISAIVAILATTAMCADSAQRVFWPIPSIAWSRALGNHPPGGAGAIQTRRGIPLGGIGAGNFMYNLTGTFGPWELAPYRHSEEFPGSGAFHFRETVGGQTTYNTLATEDLLQTWKPLNVGDGTYSALYPKAWVTYNTFKTDLSLKVFSPIIAQNYKETSYPVGIFVFQASNPTASPAEITLMFTFPNIRIFRQEETYKEIGVVKGSGEKRIDSQNGITGVVLSRKKKDYQWAIASKPPEGAKVSYVTSWNAFSGKGGDIYKPFAENGVLPDSSLDDSGSAAAVAVTLTLKPGERAEIPFAVAWDFPVLQFIVTNTEWYRRYTEYWGKDGGKAFDIASEALNNYKDWEKKIDEWEKPIVEEKAYPDWLKQAAINELYYDTFGGIFWENGCKTFPSEFRGLHPEDHKYFNMESNRGAKWAETFDVRHYECRHNLLLWPEIERSVLITWADFITDPNNKDGRTPHDAGNVFNGPIDPYFGYGYGTTNLPWKDLPSKYIQETYAYFLRTGDMDFLKYTWPAVKRTYEFMKTTDTDGDGLPNNHGSDNTYDAMDLEGTTLLCGSLWIGALEAMQKMAEAIGDGSIAKESKELIPRARENLDKQLWDEKGKYYHMDTGSRYATAVMADGLNGQRFAETTGLDPVLPSEHLRLHFHKIFDVCVKPLKDYNGDGVGDVGAATAIFPDGKSVGAGYSDDVWVGATYFTAAMMYAEGKRSGDMELMDEALKTAYGPYYTTWLNDESAYWFNTPEGWRYVDVKQSYSHQYERARAIWELMLEIKNPYERKP